MKILTASSEMSFACENVFRDQSRSFNFHMRLNFKY